MTEYIHPKRRATTCRLIKESIDRPGYFKYLITIKEKDGVVHTEYAYGKDMQSALNRLIMKERTFKIGAKLNTIMIFLIWGAIMTWPLLVLGGELSPAHLLYSFASIAAIGAGLIWWNHYINKN
tara:strand:- start:689 stop:1060 length:372 start_codon:yes stop_codon:yes gene_type:complete